MIKLYKFYELINRNATVTLANLVEEANALGEEIGVKIILQHEDIFNTMYRV